MATVVTYTHNVKTMDSPVNCLVFTLGYDSSDVERIRSPLLLYRLTSPGRETDTFCRIRILFSDPYTKNQPLKNCPLKRA